MPTETTYDQLRCADGIDTATLSAWRDAQLTPNAQASLRAHVADCVACQQRLAQFGAIAHALASQRELEPGDRIVAGVRERAAQVAEQSAWRRRLGAHAPLAPLAWLPGWRRAHDAEGDSAHDTNTTASHDGATRRARDPRRKAPRRVWGGLGAVASVAAVLLLFVYVFHTLSLGAPTQGRSHPTPTGIAHAATATPTTAPTLTPTSPRTDAQTAWGTSAIVATVSNTIDSTHVFEVSSPSFDGRSLLGYELTLDSSGAVLAPSQAQAGLFDIASKTFTPIGVNTDTTYPVDCCQDDGRYLVASYLDAPQQTSLTSQSTIMVYDRTTGVARQVADNNSFNGGTILSHTLSNGYLIIGYTSIIVAANLTTGSISVLPGLPTNDSYHVLAFTWPYVVYAQQASNANAVHAYNLTTGQDTVIPQLLKPYFELGSNYSFRGLVVVGDTAYYSVEDLQNSGLVTLYKLAHFLDSSSQAQTVARVYALIILLGANTRVIVSTDGEWDLAQQRFVDGPVLNTGGDPEIGGYWPLGINGRYLMYFKAQDSIPSSGIPTGHEIVTVYDTSQLPVT